MYVCVLVNLNKFIILDTNKDTWYVTIWSAYHHCEIHQKY